MRDLKEGSEGLLENSGFRRRWNVCDDEERECQRGVFQTEAAATTAGGKDCADPGNRQQIGVGEA